MSTEDVLSRAIETSLSLQELPPNAWTSENAPYPWNANPSTLQSLSHPSSFTTGTGLDVYSDVLLPALEAAEQEVILVTCFWAPSDALTRLSSGLKRLSRKALARNDGSRIRVRICLSSRSLLQKLLHTSSRGGHVYPPSSWSSRLGLPPPDEVRGLDLRVKSLFFRPFSVMHSKFLVVDRRRAWMPSCNVSWELWYECCIALDGPVVRSLLDFWEHFWGCDGFAQDSLEATPDRSSGIAANGRDPSSPLDMTTRANTLSLPPSLVLVILLPSQHHSSLRQSFPFWFITTPRYPLTPLNVTLIHLLTTAETSIHIITPNLTSPPVIKALLVALERGVDVSLTTNRRMMVVEQLLTAASLTEFWAWRLAKQYRRLQARAAKAATNSASQARDLEEARRPGALGGLRIRYFRSAASGSSSGPVKCHVKCAAVDGKIVVLGSGNQDRASWYTSQELGVALCGEEVVGRIWRALSAGLEGRTEDYFVQG